MRSLRSRAAATYSCSRSVSTAARTVRAMIGANRTPIMMISVVLEGPSATATSRAMMIVGSARIASMIRLSTSSTNPRK